MNSVSLSLVCEKFLRRYPENAELLWEVEQTGGLYQRTNIASKVQVLDLSGETYHTLDRRGAT